MTEVVPEGWPRHRTVAICESCLKGDHFTFGWNHLNVPANTDESELSRYSCKNVGILDGKQVQCACNAAFSELLKTIEKHEKKSNILHKYRFKKLGNSKA